VEQEGCNRRKTQGKKNEVQENIELSNNTYLSVGYLTVNISAAVVSEHRMIAYKSITFFT
jgi:outer membrane protein assembly factor BamA